MRPSLAETEPAPIDATATHCESVDARFASVDRLYGDGSVKRLASRHVAIIGVGGVGSWAVEALARTGVGALTLIDADEVCVGNTNRQLHAMEGCYGHRKVDVLAQRVRAINPGCEVTVIPSFVTPSNIAQTLGPALDLILDCCDSFRVKVEVIAHCRRNKWPLIVCGSAGGRTDPTRIQCRDLSRTEHDALLSMIRRKLRSEFNFPRSKDRYFGVPAVYSLENVRYPQPDGTVSGMRPSATTGALKLDCDAGLGAAMHVTAAFAMVAVGKALDRLLEPEKPRASRPPTQE